MEQPADKQPEQDEKVPEVSEPAPEKPFDVASCKCNYCGSKPSLYLHRDDQARDAPLRSVCVDCFVSLFDKVLGVRD